MELGFGLMRLPLKDPSDRTSIDFEKTSRLVASFLENGGQLFDTACKYHGGESETAVRNCIASCYERKTFRLADKITLDFVQRPEDQYPFFKNQLRKCGVSYFDRYLIHSLGPLRYPKAQAFDTFSFLSKLKRKGFVKEIGFSYHGDAATLEQILTDHPEVDFVQLQLNYVDWDDPIVEARRCWEIAVQHAKQISVMEPLKGGMIVRSALEKDHANLISLAFRFIAEKANVNTILSGMNEPEHVVQNLRIMRSLSPLIPDELAFLQSIAEEYRKNSAVSCSGCGYCLEVCPKAIPIPTCFALFNQSCAANGYNDLNRRIYYKNITSQNGKASGCLKCGKCEKLCPQRIPIRETLKLVVARFE